ncbi:MAG: hypothetical protein IPQ11_09640 [Bacteroidetes bacterium]|nr:hypothetical protein [Bacteroidota bacterium]
MKNSSILIVFVFTFCKLQAQTWQELPNAPAAQFVNDDIFFINDNIGWMVNLDGFIYKTIDGGDTWDTLIIQPGTAFRSIGFFDEMNGYCGNLGPGSWITETTDTIPLYQTHDGGTTWTPVTTITGAPRQVFAELILLPTLLPMLLADMQVQL